MIIKIDVSQWLKLQQSDYVVGHKTHRGVAIKNKVINIYD